MIHLDCTKQKIAIIGATRGLGRRFVEVLTRELDAANFLFVARKIPALDSLKQGVDQAHCETFACDLSTAVDQDQLVAFLEAWQPTRIFYFAGGGPYGEFLKKNWRDHDWAWQVSFVAAAKLIHRFANRDRQLVFIGSQVAEANPDPLAASYAAAKHALRGLITSIKAENPDFNLHLFSPGYMDTDMLPPGSKVRVSGVPIADPAEIAEQLWATFKVGGIDGNNMPNSEAPRA